MTPKPSWILPAAFVACALCDTTRAADADTRGYMYGTVVAESGTEYTGVLRWGTEESFWDDLFQGTKEDLPYIKHETRSQSHKVTVLGIPIGYRWDNASTGRLLVARFGDIKELRRRGSDRVELRMKDGDEVEVNGGSNDVEATVTVYDKSLGKVDLAWDRIERVTFAQAPHGAEVPGRRLYGKVRTEATTFEGFVQWDKQECVSEDKLDGETTDGDVSIAMGKIKRIERRGSTGSRVTLDDGRELNLRGTNDVNEENRGIVVEDERFGRVEITWDVFESVDFENRSDSGRSYDDYQAGRSLRGTVTDFDDKTYTGTLVFDLDESKTWELLQGMLDGVEYHIPFERIRRIRPSKSDTSLVELRGGQELTLEESQDVSESNSGVVVLRGEDEREAYIAWRDVKEIRFE